ncbi:MAG: asparagine synthase (glutamine-hydrolyzing) [Bacteroidetes bacterium]|nr:asparagine synthase (glutamine-hydrolyzing) [Bacteroidota bacterium]
MCGINGFFNFSQTHIDGGADLITKMNNRIRYRGPDDSGSWNNGQDVFFGHLRLSIIDLSPTGHQPMVARNGNVIVFNGEIYNYKEIKERFFRDYQFDSTGDTEVLLLLYEKFGEDCLQYLNGMFAFAIWNPQKKELFLARDRAGKKPLYYSLQNGVFAFSSELKAILELPWIKKELDEKALYHFLTYSYLPPPLTMFRNIFKFHPAHHMTVNSNGIKNYASYWDVSYSDLGSKSEDELKELIFSGLKKAVDYRMVSDVPVGAFLSGGVDSSAIVALMSSQASYPVKTYSIGFKDQPEYDELKFAGQVAKQFGTDHYEKIISQDDIIGFLPKVVDLFDEPMADATCVPIYFISQKARENGTIVVLTGDGSDELFGGYRNWLKYLKLYPNYYSYLKLPRPLRKIISSVYEKFDNTSPVYEILFRAASNQEFFWGGANSFKESTKRKFISEKFIGLAGELNSYEVISEYKSLFEKNKKGRSDFSDIDWMCYIGYKFIIPNYYMYRADHLGMAHSIEIRTPFLDYEFTNLAMSVPGKYKVRNGEPKYILKKSLEGILSQDILYRKKRGFNVPLRKWAGDIMIDYVEKNLDRFCERSELFNESELRTLITRLKKGDENTTNQLWTIYFLMSWFDKWIS